jgi:hypothetical protein
MKLTQVLPEAREIGGFPIIMVIANSPNARRGRTKTKDLVRHPKDFLGPAEREPA